MANVIVFFGSWASTGDDNDMAPGQVDGWYFDYGVDTSPVFSISAQPVVGAPESRFLTVENIVVEGGPLENGQIGRRVNYDIRNAGPTFIDGYMITVSLVTA
jgi:hypothetical protein